MMKRLFPNAAILLYHRVAQVESDPQLLCVTPRHFAEQLKILRGECRVLPLRHLVQLLHEGTIPDRAVAVTFDDGYADNLYYAKPCLECCDVPATVFVTAGYLGQEYGFWWDELNWLLLNPGRLPETLCLSVNGTVRQWKLGASDTYGEEDFAQYRLWNVLEKHDPSRRQVVYRALCQDLRPLSEEGGRRVLDQLYAWAGSDRTRQPVRCVLTPDEVIRLGDGGLVEVGAHTMTHPVLAAISATLQRQEISGSKARLEEILGHPVVSFSYPYGAVSDYTKETVSLVRELGYSYACSNFDDVVWPGSDCFQLPRVLVRNWDGEEFARRLRGWFRE